MLHTFVLQKLKVNRIKGRIKLKFILYKNENKLKMITYNKANNMYNKKTISKIIFNFFVCVFCSMKLFKTQKKERKKLKEFRKSNIGGDNDSCRFLQHMPLKSGLFRALHYTFQWRK